jgi:hypothetical protein
LIITEEKRATYSAAISALALVTSATDFFTISGSLNKTIIVKRIRFSATAPGTAQIIISLLKRSTLNAGGTSTTLTNVPHDTTNPPATAVVKTYTANPSSLGTLVGSIREVLYTAVASGSNLISDIREFTFGQEEDQGLVIRGPFEMYAFNFNAQAVSGSAFNVSIEWREIVGG